MEKRAEAYADGLRTWSNGLSFIVGQQVLACFHQGTGLSPLLQQFSSTAQTPRQRSALSRNFDQRNMSLCVRQKHVMMLYNRPPNRGLTVSALSWQIRYLKYHNWHKS